MTVQISVIGLGQIGASLGLALAEYKGKILRVGHDPDGKRMQSIEKLGAFDKTFVQLHEAVRNADIVILALPADLIRDALAIMKDELKPGAVVINISIIRKGIHQWIEETLPKENPFISIHPLIHADRLEDANSDVNTPRADLFTNTEIAITNDYNTSSKAIEVATDLATLLKAKPYYTETAEADGVVANVEQLPKLAAAALVHTLIGKAGWNDGRRFSSRAFYRSASINYLSDEQEYLGITALLNKENICRSLNELIYSLEELRNLIDQGNEDGVKKYLKEARQGFETWIEQRRSGDWDHQRKEMPQKPKDRISQLFEGKTKEKS
jgi:prephenate dehydrogenase